MCAALPGVLGGLPTTGCAQAARERERESASPAVVAPPAADPSCRRKPEAAVNPPVPAGWVQVKDSSVTPEMAAWATAIVKNRDAYPMCSSTTRTFGTATILARVEWHPPDFNVQAVHRGVTLYERDGRPLGASRR